MWNRGERGVAKAGDPLAPGRLERVERQDGAKRVRFRPARDAPRAGVDDERDVDASGPDRVGTRWGSEAIRVGVD